VDAKTPADAKPALSFSKPPVTPGEPLRLEIESFLDSVRTRREPRVTARQGRDALALALEIQAAMAAHAHRAGLQDFFAIGQFPRQSRQIANMTPMDRRLSP
jgi:predicted dehydrogenase